MCYKHKGIMHKEEARQALLDLLVRAYSGELAAALAYMGHTKAVSSREERDTITRIRAEELDHRRHLARMIHQLGGSVDVERETRMNRIGTFISNLCRYTRWIPGSWFATMYGAGWLEYYNIEEYEEAARLAVQAGYEDFVQELISFAEVEWNHEQYFRTKAQSSWLAALVSFWPKPKLKNMIREDLCRFRESLSHQA